VPAIDRCQAARRAHRFDGASAGEYRGNRCLATIATVATPDDEIDRILVMDERQVMPVSVVTFRVDPSE
jgi:hypothetical protein